MDDAVATCGKVIKTYNEEIKTIPTNFEKKNINCKTHSFYILLAFKLIIIALLIAVRIYILFLDSAKLTIVWIKITTFFKSRVSIIL